jgi:hypothetical protein
VKTDDYASALGETASHFLVESNAAAPKLHRAGADEPGVPEPTGIADRSSVGIPESTRNQDAAFRTVLCVAAVVALAQHLAPARAAP